MAKPTPIRKQRAPKAARRAVAQGGTPQFSLDTQTLQLAHEAIVQMRKPNSQVMMACAQAMNQIENVLAVAGQRTQQQQQADAAAAAEAEAPAPAPAKKK